MNLYFVNTDKGRQSPAEWLSRGVAVATDSETNMRALSKIGPGDGVLAYENGVGIVAFGRALAGGIREIRDPSRMVNGSERVEYHLPIQWEADLRHAPVSHSDVRQFAGVQPVRTCQQVHAGREWILQRLREAVIPESPETRSARHRVPHTSSVDAAAISKTLAIAIAIEWDETIETIPLELGVLSQGDSIQTLETWKDGTEPTIYHARCVASRKDGGWHIELFYDRDQSANAVIALDYPDVEWGTLSLNVSEDIATATAIFKPDNGAPAGTGTCTTMRTGLYANLTRAQVNVLLRPGQPALRDSLLTMFKRCAVSNENAKDALEAAHIVDHSAGGAARMTNAILLRADIHALFDAGKLQIDADGLVKLVGLPSDSRYHTELATSWNKRLPSDVMVLVKHALAERSERSERPLGAADE